MSETYGLRLTCAQRLVASDLLPELGGCLMLDTRNERTIPLTQKQIERLRDAASKAIGDAPTGTVRNSLRHIVDKSSDILTRESAAKEVMRLKVTLVGSDPPIWRRIETHDCSLATLHDIIQVAMGWEDYHLHRFQVGKKQYGTPDPMDADFGIRLIDERKVRLSEVIAGAGQRVKFVYEYDFGDGWQHAIKLEGTARAEPGIKYPRCTDGKRSGPPEDVGGVWGYAEFLEAIADPEHERHEELMEWAGEFDPDEFLVDDVNRDLRKIRC